MTVLASHDLKESLSDNRIVTAEDLRACLRYPHKPLRRIAVRLNTPCGGRDRFEERKAGEGNDVALGSAIDELPLHKISAPTLFIHGDADNDVPPRDAEYAHEAIADARLLWVHKASHIGFWVAEDAYKVQKYTLDWMRQL